MLILGIDTSCDDTCITVLEIRNSKLEIKSNIVSSQVKIHQKYGGVYPSLAKREHQRNLPIVLKRALRKAGFEISNFKFLISKQIPKTKLKIPNIDAIAVTIGPGLEPCLWTGINFAKDLAKKLNPVRDKSLNGVNLPIVPVNHIEAHILANFIGENSTPPLFKKRAGLNSKLFPAICLVVSGGHTQLILMRGIGRYKLIGETRDDAAGECFDKTARILGLGYPGGPAIAAEAEKFQVFPISSRILDGKAIGTSFKFQVKMPRPMIHQKNYDFSFSGLKTAVLYDFQSRPPKERRAKKYLQAMAFEIQQAIIDVLIYKTIRAAKDYKVKSIILGGGVASNNELRGQFRAAISNLQSKIKFLVPPKKFCTDNATMIALTAFFHWKKATKDWQKIKANANLKI